MTEINEDAYITVFIKNIDGMPVLVDEEGNPINLVVKEV